MNKVYCQAVARSKTKRTAGATSRPGPRMGIPRTGDPPSDAGVQVINLWTLGWTHTAELFIMTRMPLSLVEQTTINSESDQENPRTVLPRNAGTTVGADVTGLLIRMASGDAPAEAELVRLLYGEFRQVAAARLSPSDHTLSPTVVVHEAFIRVFRKNNGIPLQNRKHLFFAFAQAAWRIVVEHWRRSRPKSVLEDPAVSWLAATSVPSFAIGELDCALRELQVEYPREYEVAILRASLGFTIEEAAQILEVAPMTIKRRWSLAKAFLARHLQRSGCCESGA